MINKRKKVYVLSFLWIASYLMVWISGYVIMLIDGKATGIYHFPSMMSGFQLFLLFSVIVYFLPLLWTIYKNAKMAKLHSMVCIARVLLFIFSIWSVFVGIATVIHAI